MHYAARLRGSRDGLAGQVLQDLVVEGSVVRRPGVAPTTLMTPDRVRATELPQYCPQAYIQHAPVEKGLYSDFSALQQQPYKVCVGPSDTVRLNLKVQAGCKMIQHL